MFTFTSISVFSTEDSNGFCDLEVQIEWTLFDFSLSQGHLSEEFSFPVNNLNLLALDRNKNLVSVLLIGINIWDDMF